MNSSLTAYVPCFNNAATIRRAVESLFAQTVRPGQVLVIDDGSTDGPEAMLAGLDVRVIRHDRNLGRGAARARAMQEARGEFVACCDATNVLAPDFIATALKWMTDANTAAVFGKFTQPPARNAVERWRGRHLFKLDVKRGVVHGALLATSGAVVRASAARAAGGYSARLRHTEDGDLGARLLAQGFDVVYDPGCRVISMANNTMLEVMERYWRWYAGTDERVSWRAYGKNIAYSIRGMAWADLRARDPLAAGISLLAPHFQFWWSWSRGAFRRPQMNPLS